MGRSLNAMAAKWWRSTATTIAIFDDPGSEALLGAVTPGQLSLIPDPVSKRFVSVEVFLIRVPALHL